MNELFKKSIMDLILSLRPDYTIGEYSNNTGLRFNTQIDAIKCYRIIFDKKMSDEFMSAGMHNMFLDPADPSSLSELKDYLSEEPHI